MQYLGIDWGTRRAAWCALTAAGELIEGTIPADEEGLTRLVARLGPDVRGCIEMMSGAVWVRDRLAECGWTVEIADASASALAAPFKPVTELLMTSLIGWATAERVWLTLFGSLSKTTDQAARRLLESRFVPGAFLRQTAVAHANDLEARQNWPHTTSLRCAQSHKPHASSPQRDAQARPPKEKSS